MYVYIYIYIYTHVPHMNQGSRRKRATARQSAGVGLGPARSSRAPGFPTDILLRRSTRCDFPQHALAEYVLI